MIRSLRTSFTGSAKKIALLIGMLCFLQVNLLASDLFSSFADEKLVKVSRFYPNPATSVINFEFAADVDKTYTLQIYNFTGKKAFETPVSTDKIKVDLTSFYRGLYFFQLRDRSGRIIETGKFQVVR
jgi:hypothetical protein